MAHIKSPGPKPPAPSLSCPLVPVSNPTGTHPGRIMQPLSLPPRLPLPGKQLGKGQHLRYSQAGPPAMGLSWPLVDSHRSQSSRSSTNISKSWQASESRGLGAGALPGPWPSAGRRPGLRVPLGSVTSSSRLIIPQQPRPLLAPRVPALLRDGRLDRSGLCPTRARDGWAFYLDSPRPQACSGLLPAPTRDL